MQRTAVSLQNGFRLGVLAVYPRRNMVVHEERSIHIEPKVMDVLCLLAGRSGDVVGRDELIDEVWKVEYGADESLTRAISLLRKSFREAGETDRYIETIAKRGYRLVQSVSHIDERAGTAEATPIALGPAPLPPDRETLLAVLAFDNLSNDPELSYFSDGVSEEILYTVARARGMRVIGKASSFQFRGADKTAQKVAEGLGATHMLDGSVRRAGDSIRVSVELVDTTSLETLWTDRYDRALNDIFALQDDIAAAISAALNHHFAEDQTPMRVDPAAYDSYLKALAIYSQDLTWADREECMRLLEDAVSRSPNFARAWGRLAIYRQGHSAIVAAQRGLRIDPNCTTSLAALSMAKPAFAEHSEKLELCERAYLLSPDDQLVAGVFNLVLISLGFLSRSCELSEARLQRDPLSPMVAGSLAIAYRNVDRNADAIALANRVIGEFPDADYMIFMRGVIAIFDGDIDCAAEMADMVSADDGIQPLQVLVAFIRAVTAMDPETRAATAAQFLRRKAPESFIVDIGLVAALGESDMAMEHLLETVREDRPLEFSAENDGRGTTASTVTAGLFMPNCEVLRRDVRFAEVCVRLRLYDFWQETGLWPDCIEALAPLYDLKEECAKIVDSVGRYNEAR